MSGRSDKPGHDGDEPTSIATPRSRTDTRRGFDPLSSTTPAPVPSVSADKLATLDDDDEANFDGDDPPTTAEPLGDYHLRLQAAEDAFSEEGMPTMIDPQPQQPLARRATPVGDHRPTVDLGPQAKAAVDAGQFGKTLLDPPRGSPMPPLTAARGSEQPTVPVSPAAINSQKPAFDMDARVDDSARTVRWEGREVEKVVPRSRPPTARPNPPPFARPNAPTAPPPFRGAPPNPSSLPLPAPGQSLPLPQQAPHGFGQQPPPGFGPYGPPPQPPFGAQPYPSQFAPLAPQYPVQPNQHGTDAMRAISMKTPMETEAEKQARVMPQVQLRAMSDLRETPRHGMGHLAPPHDARDARSRRVQDLVIWGSVVVITASLVTLVIWFLAR